MTLHYTFGKFDLLACGIRKVLASLDDSCLITMACLEAVLRTALRSLLIDSRQPVKFRHALSPSREVQWFHSTMSCLVGKTYDQREKLQLRDLPQALMISCF